MIIQSVYLSKYTMNFDNGKKKSSLIGYFSLSLPLVGLEPSILGSGVKLKPPCCRGITSATDMT
jgi:hypothetical protein